MRQLIALAGVALGVLLAVPAIAQPCEVLGTCPRPTPAPRPPATPSPRPPAQPATPRVDPCVALWRTANSSGTIAAYENFISRCPRHSQVPTARRQITTLRCNADWARADFDRTLDGYLAFERHCANHREIATARTRIAAIRAAPWDGAGLPALDAAIPRAGLAQEQVRLANSCVNGQMAACTNLGLAFSRGAGAPQDRQWSAALYARACAGGEPTGCANLGSFFNSVSGSGDGNDYARAVTLYERACNANARFACTGLGGMFHAGRGVEENHVTEIEYYVRGCNEGNPGGDAVGCLAAGRSFERGTPGARRDLARALQLAEMGLRLQPVNAELIALRDRLRR
jgi:hypothetical protein